MPRNLKLSLEDRPGTLAHVGETLGKAGVNIDGLSSFNVEGGAIVNILVEDAAAARKALEGAGVTVQEDRDVLVLEVKDQPGELGRICRKIADAGVNIEVTYLATNTRLVVGADDLAKARAATG